MDDTGNKDQETPKTDPRWAEHELEGLELGDARVERRVRRVAEDLSGQPEYPINQASSDSAATKAAYRLFDNEKASPEKIFSAHRKKSLLRMREEPLVIAIQDTSYFNFTSHKKVRGLGPIGASDREQQGLVMHSTLAVTPAGLPLGVLTQQCWAREGFCNSDATYRKRAFQDKESYKWVSTLQEICEIPISAGTKVIHVADRECDIYEFLRESKSYRQSYVIRACYDRAIESTEYASVQEQLKAIVPQACIELEMPTEKRKAVLDMTFAPVTLKAPGRIAESERIAIPCWVVHVSEPKPPDGCEALTWTLLTNVEVTSVEAALERLSWYRRRWSIEEFHKILKSGCAVEDCRLQTAERLKRYIALFCVIAWRIFWMVHIQRADPKAPAEVVLTKTEIGALCSLKRFQDKRLAAATLTVKQAVIATACLGGYLNRKNDPPPGPTALWRGWQRLSSMAELYESMAPTGCG